MHVSLCTHDSNWPGVIGVCANAAATGTPADSAAASSHGNIIANILEQRTSAEPQPCKRRHACASLEDVLVGAVCRGLLVGAKVSSLPKRGHVWTPTYRV